MAVGPTPIQNIALSLIFQVVGESRYNRTAADYMAIASRLPPLKRLHFMVNAALRKFLESCPTSPPEMLRFSKGHQRYCFEPYPCSISMETIRAALVVSGMREPPRR